MKKVVALLLCLALLMVLPTGCKKKTEAPDASRICSDLLNCSHLYYYAHIGKVSSMTLPEIVEKTETKDTITYAVTAKAMTPYSDIQLSATMKYTLVDNAWQLDKESVKITKKEAIPTAAPDLETMTKDNLANYLSIVGKALAVKGEEEYLLPAYDVSKATWETKYEKGATTATLNVTYQSDELSFTGYYNITFGENGWMMESKMKDEIGHILLHLETLEQKEAASTDEK